MTARLRLNLALLSARLVTGACRLFHYPGTSLPGVIALRICPDAVDLMTPAYDLVLAVTGTNGKTTTANLLAHILRAAGCSVAHNALGANMLPGVATALFRDRQFSGRPRSRIALLEVDEGSVGKVFAAARPGVVIVTNYFRDQLDRYWELERTTAQLCQALAGLPGVTLILNADDPLVAAVGQGQASARYFGALKEAGTSGAGNGSGSDAGEEAAGACEIREGRFCQRCGIPLTYNYFHFGQLGDYFCSSCGFRRPELDYAAHGLGGGEMLSMSISMRQASGTSRELLLTTQLRGFYNVYNILAAAAAARELGIEDGVIEDAVRGYRTATGRMQDFIFAGRLCTLALIKNPVGANEVLKTLIRTTGGKALVIAINDLAADGRDVSWLWDADFACLADPSIKKVVCAGLRAADFAVCLKYAGVPLERIELAPGRSASLRRLAAQQADKLYVLATYTNLFGYARLLGRTGRVVQQRAH
jgi:UDP-N-acetylmuramyl tripeptide synthase